MHARPPDPLDRARDRATSPAPPPPGVTAADIAETASRPSDGARTDWRRVLQHACVSGTVAALASAATVALLARRRTGSLASGANATSHVLWGESAARCHQADLRHTAIGYAIHHGSAVFWATGFEWLLARRRPPRPVVAAAATAATAYVVDYHMVPKRLTPGFELHLSRREMAGVYAAIAAGLALTAMARGHRASRG